MERSESELDNAVWMRHSVKEDSAGLDMWYERTTSEYLDRHCTGRFQLPGFKRGPGYPGTNCRSTQHSQQD